MTPEIYIWFAKHWLSDLAIRRSLTGEPLLRGHRRVRIVSGVKQRMRLYGDHICYHEEVDQPLFRGPDSTFRLAMAVMACERYGRAIDESVFSHSSACRMVAEFLLSSPELPIRSQFLKGTRGPKQRAKLNAPASAHEVAKTKIHKPIDRSGWDQRLLELDAMEQEEKRRQQSEVSTTVKKLANTIRSQVDDFLKHNPNFEHQFEAWLGVFRFTHWRDVEWFNEVEGSYEKRATALALAFAHDPWTAMATSSLARLLYDQGKHAKATPAYKLAIEQWQAVASVSPERRSEAIAILEQELADIKSVVK